MTKAHRVFAVTSANFLMLVTTLFNPILASVGLEEWHVATPGKNFLGHFDPFADHGTVIISRERDEPRLHVKQINRWQYYRGYVAGEADHQFFLFNERNKELKQFSSEQQLNDAIAQLKLGKAKSKWFTPKEGWEKTWGKVKNAKIKTEKNDAQGKSTSTPE